MTLILLCNAWCWVQGTSLYGCWAGLWWEETKWGHRASWRACLASNITEVSQSSCLSAFQATCLFGHHHAMSWQYSCWKVSG